MENAEGGLSLIEKRSLRDLGEVMGGSYVQLVEHTNKLSEQEALWELDSKS
jgi:hypothetical protein